MKTLYKIGEVIFQVVQLIVLITISGFLLYLIGNEELAKYKIYRYINQQIDL